VVIIDGGSDIMQTGQWYSKYIN